MPHKRAKRSVREQQRISRIADQAPTSASNINTEEIPKSIARVLNAVEIRSKWKESLAKRKREEYDQGSSSADRREKQKQQRTGTPASNKQDGSKALSILPGESMSHFNKRVEDKMRPLLNSALQSSSVRKHKGLSHKKVQHSSSSEHTSMKSSQGSNASKGVASDAAPSRPTDFAKISASAPRRLNDVVQAPPQLKRLPRGAVHPLPGNDPIGTGSSVVSMSQRLMMEAERENAIRRYRELKEKRLKEKIVNEGSVP